MLRPVSQLADETEAGSDAEALLSRWRERVLGGLIGTTIVALVPASAIHIWQGLQGTGGVQSGMWTALISIVLLSALGLWRGPYRIRAALLIGLCAVVSVILLFLEGFSPALCVLLCLLATVCSLLYSTRFVVGLLAFMTLAMGVAAALFSRGVLSSIGTDHYDVRNPLNWLR